MNVHASASNSLSTPMPLIDTLASFAPALNPTVTCRWCSIMAAARSARAIM